MSVNRPVPNLSQQGDAGHRSRPEWRQSLVDTESGLRTGLRSDATIAVYFFVFSVVIAASAVVGLSLLEWAFIVLAVGAVLASQMFHCMISAVKGLLPADDEKGVRSVMQFGVAAVTVTNLSALAAVTLIILPRLISLLN